MPSHSGDCCSESQSTLFWILSLYLCFSLFSFGDPQIYLIENLHGCYHPSLGAPPFYLGPVHPCLHLFGFRSLHQYLCYPHCFFEHPHSRLPSTLIAPFAVFLRLYSLGPALVHPPLLPRLPHPLLCRHHFLLLCFLHAALPVSSQCQNFPHFWEHLPPPPPLDDLCPPHCLPSLCPPCHSVFYWIHPHQCHCLYSWLHWFLRPLLFGIGWSGL
mmetsp:Transcript_21629/g.28046  ORF Transcript_21629/g.28046 Transcript_21629/m.28046 type:complete len:214 (+) Transcript_21629:887-1528(+)